MTWEYVRAWTPILHDPGKLLFHIVMLPLSLFLLVDRFPAALRRQLWKTIPGMTVSAVAIALFAYGLMDCQDGFDQGQRMPWPTDFADREVGRHLVEETFRLNADIAAPTNAPTEDRARYLSGIPDRLGVGRRAFWVAGSARAQFAAVLFGIGSALAGFWFVMCILFRDLSHGGPG